MLAKVVFALCIVVVASLSLEDVEEGDCRGVHFPPVPDRGVDFLATVPTFRNIVAGSRWDLYQFASGHPRFRQMREPELRDSMCLTHNGTDNLGRGAAFGFGGRLLATYSFTPRKGQTTVFNFSLLPNSNAGGTSPARSTHTITMTDYKSFVFFSNCFTVNGSQHKSWEVLSLTPNISLAARRRIEQHATSLGFNPDNFVFLNYNSCGAGYRQNDRVSAGSWQDNWRNGEVKRGLSSSGNRSIFGRSGWSK